MLLLEGEKAADAAAMLFPDLISIASQGGSKAAGQTDWSPLAGRAVTIWPDHDAAGVEYAEAVQRLLTKAGAASVRVVSVPADLPEGWDVADALPDGVTLKSLKDLLASAAECSDAADTANVDLPGLFVNSANLPRTADELRGHLAKQPRLFDRGVPVRLTYDVHAQGVVAQPLGTDGVVREAHRVVQPWKFLKSGGVMERTDSRAASNRTHASVPRKSGLRNDTMMGECPVRE